MAGVKQMLLRLSDSGTGIAVDAAGDVYIAGTSDATWGSPTVPFQGRFGDAFAAKLNGSGGLQWNIFMGSGRDYFGRGIAVDGTGSIYIGGGSFETFDSHTGPYSGPPDAFAAKLNPSGGLNWIKYYGANRSSEIGESIAVDASGNVYVGGTSGYTWGNPIRPIAGTDAFAAKLNASGVLQWNTFLGGNGGDEGKSIAVDGTGNVYVAGTSYETWGSPIRPHSGSPCDAFAAKLNSSGVLQWNTFLGGGGYCAGEGIAVDGSGNSYVTGSGDGTWGNPIRPFSGQKSAFAAKLSASGVLQWNTFLGGDGWTWAYGIAVDGSGNVYVGGRSYQTWGSPVKPFGGNYQDAFAAKLNANGALQWNTFFGEEGFGDHRCEGIAVDRSGNVFVVGISNWTWGNPIRPIGSYQEDAFAAKLNSSGLLQWNTFLGGSGLDFGLGLAVDGAGNVYVAGTSYATWGSPVRLFGGGQDAFAAKLSPSGGLLWNAFLGGDAGDGANGIAVDSSGNVYETGSSSATWGNPLRAFGKNVNAFVAVVSVDPSAPILILSSPDGGESWSGGSTHNITWTAMGTIANVKLEYSTDNGVNWTTIIASTTNDGSHPWSLPVVASSNCLVRVGEAVTGIPGDVSNAVFSIVKTSPVIGLSKTSVAFGAEQNGTPSRDCGHHEFGDWDVELDRDPVGGLDLRLARKWNRLRRIDDWYRPDRYGAGFLYGDDRCDRSERFKLSPDDQHRAQHPAGGDIGCALRFLRHPEKQYDRHEQHCRHGLGAGRY
jgi:hypothetical protein